MKKLFTLILIAFSMSAFAQVNLDIAATHVEAAPGTITNVEITIESDLWNCNGIAGSIHWDPLVAAYSTISDFGILFNPAMVIGDFDLSATGDGIISWTWFPTFTVGPSLVPGELLFTIEFLAVGDDGTFTDITFSNSPENLWWNSGGIQTGTFDGDDGSITVGGLNLTGCYDPDFWTSDTENTNGTVFHSAGIVTMTGDNDQTGNGTVGIDCAGTDGNVTYCVTIPNSGTVSFDWDYTVADIAESDGDAFGYCLSGVATQLATPNPPPFGTPFGTATFDVVGGDELCLIISSENSSLTNAPVVAISNFTGPPCELPSLTAEIVQNDLVGCVGEANASLEVILEFAEGEVTYDWGDNSLEGSNPTGLSAGNYCVTVIDAVPDTAYVCYEIIEAETPLSASGISNPDDGTGTGMILLNVSGGLAPYTITWDTDPVQTGPIIQGLDNGVYTYTLVDQYGCIIIGQIEVIFVGIEEITGLQRFDFYPNPTEGIINLNIEFNRNNDFTISIVNAVGQKVIDLGSSNGSQFKNTIDLSTLPAGFYYLNLTIDGFIITKKVILN